MRHHDSTRKFGRTTDVRRAFMRSLALNLIQKGKIKTTEARAKELRAFVEKLVTKAKTDTVTSRRLVISRMGGETGVKELFAEIAPKYTKREGGYTRVIKLPARLGDGSKMAVIEFV